MIAFESTSCDILTHNHCNSLSILMGPRSDMPQGDPVTVESCKVLTGAPDCPWAVEVSATAPCAGALEAPPGLLASDIIGASATAVANGLLVSIPTVSNWRRGRCRIPPRLERRLYDLVTECLTLTRREQQLLPARQSSDEWSFRGIRAGHDLGKRAGLERARALRKQPSGPKQRPGVERAILKARGAEYGDDEDRPRGRLRGRDRGAGGGGGRGMVMSYCK